MIDRIRTRLHRALAGVDDATVRLARAATTWAPWPVLIGMGVGVGGWAARNPARLAQLDTNKLTEPERHWMLAGVGAAVAAVALVYFLALLGRRVRTGAWRFHDTVSRLNGYLAPLMAIPVVAALRVPNVEKDSVKLTLLLCAVAAAIAGASVYTWGRSPRLTDDADATFGDMPGGARRAGAGRWIAPLLLAALWAAYAIFFSRLALINHHALVTRTTDLGYYDNIFYQSIHGHPLGCSFIKAGYHGSAHFDPILVLLSPLYLIYPRAEFLLVLQSVWLGAGVVPVYLLARHKLGDRARPLLLAVAWALYPALHGANMYEFHSLTLISPLVVALLYFYESGKSRGYWITLLLLLLCREDVALLMCFVGLYGLFDGRAGKARTGWLTIAASLVYFVIVKAFFMTSAGIFMSGKDAYSFAYYYEDLMPNRSGLGGLVLSLLTNPVFALKTMLEEAKVIFFLQLFLPLVFLPFLTRPGRWMLLYGLMFCLLASRDAVTSIHFQYSSVIFPVAFALTPGALRRADDGALVAFLGLDGRRLARALLGATLVASALVSWKFGGLVDNAAFKGGFARVARTLSPQQMTTYAWVRQQVASIPPGAIVGATNKLGAHVSNRKDAYFYPGERFALVEYAFIDEAELKGKDLDLHSGAVKRGELVELGRSGKMALFKREKPSAPPPPAPPTGSATPVMPAVPPTEMRVPHVGIPPVPKKTDRGATPAPSSTAEEDENHPGGP